MNEGLGNRDSRRRACKEFLKDKSAKRNGWLARGGKEERVKNTLSF